MGALSGGLISSRKAPAAATTPTLTVASGSYTGDGGASHGITGLGFKPDMAIVKGAGTQSAWFKTAQHSGNNSDSFINTPTITDGILSLDSDGFTLGANTQVNQAATTYHWFAVKDAGGLGTNIKFGTYVGNGGASHAITGVGFRPQWCFTKQITTGGGEAVQRTAEMGVNNSYVFSANTAAYTNGILSLDSDGFTVGARLAVNANLTTFLYVAFKQGTKFRTSTYTGNAAASHAVTGVGFTPAFVAVKGASTTATNVPRWRSTNGFTSTNSAGFAATVASDVTDGILSLDADGFTVGANDDANENAITYYYVAIGG